MKKYSILSFAVAFFFFAPLCSFAAKKDASMVNTLVAEEADRTFEIANKSLAAGDLRKAANYFVSAYKLAFSIDDTDLLTRICLSSISFKIASVSMGYDEAHLSGTYLASSTAELFDKAIMFSKFPGNSNGAVLSGVCEIYSVRLALSEGKSDYQGYISVLTSAEKVLSKETNYLAQLYRTKGDVYMRSGNYASARDFYQKSADMNTKNKVLGEIGMDWYNVARSCSLGGKKKDAINAIEQAIKYDRDAENTSGLGADYLAYAKILMKGNPSEDEKSLARKFAEWSSFIYDAGDFASDAEQARKYMDSIF